MSPTRKKVEETVQCRVCGKPILKLSWCPEVCGCPRDMVTKANGEVGTTMTGCLFVEDERFGRR